MVGCVSLMLQIVRTDDDEQKEDTLSNLLLFTYFKRTEADSFSHIRFVTQEHIDISQTASSNSSSITFRWSELAGFRGRRSTCRGSMRLTGTIFCRMVDFVTRASNLEITHELQYILATSILTDDLSFAWLLSCLLHIQRNYMSCFDCSSSCCGYRPSPILHSMCQN